MSEAYYKELSGYLRSGQWREDVKLGLISLPTAYNLMAQWALSDETTTMEFTPRSVGLE